MLSPLPAFIVLLCILIPGDSFKFFRGRSGAQDDRYIYEKQRYDGWFNNMAHPEWGSIGETALEINLSLEDRSPSFMT